MSVNAKHHLPNSVDFRVAIGQYGVANTSGVNSLAAKFPAVKTRGFDNHSPLAHEC